MIEREENLGGKRLEPGSPFRFSCHPERVCFNGCCQNKRLPLFPYDVLRLKRATGLSSGAFLERHATLELDPENGWPNLRIALQEDGRCPFVTPSGCQHYAHRPACCRIYPLARAASLAQGEVQEFFVEQQTDGCDGWQSEAPQSVAEYLASQELSPYQQANNRLLKLLFHPRQRPLNPQQQHAVIMALYNLDTFRELVQREGFAERFGFEAAAIEAACQSDEALLQLAERWLEQQLFV